MFLDKDYYATPARGNVPAWTNEMAEITWHHWLTSPERHLGGGDRIRRRTSVPQRGDE
jgi:hypothetical protein